VAATAACGGPSGDLVTLAAAPAVSSSTAHKRLPPAGPGASCKTVSIPQFGDGKTNPAPLVLWAHPALKPCGAGATCLASQIDYGPCIWTCAEPSSPHIWEAGRGGELVAARQRLGDEAQLAEYNDTGEHRQPISGAIQFPPTSMGGPITTIPFDRITEALHNEAGGNESARTPSPTSSARTASNWRRRRTLGGPDELLHPHR
jgi:hypothetical protein